ncbi:hypothetical protein GGI12_000971 [Dipsacomyces acuminosporus]|nr:hypothetical protein GGI12_000971 [Dipsacomyces acuminosporus]
MSGEAPSEPAAARAGHPKPLRTISDEFRELQHVIDQFQSQLNVPEGTVGLHPFGPVNAGKAKASFSQACRRLRDALTGYRDTTLTTWSGLIASNPQGAGILASTNRAAVASQELSEMRQITDTLHEDIAKCKDLLLDAAADAISQALAHSPAGQPSLLVDRAKAIAERLGLAHYTDVQASNGVEVTTVTLAGEILVIDVDISEDPGRLKAKVSYVSETEHDERIDSLMLRKLRAGDVRGFEALIGEMAQLDRLTKARSPVNFIHNMFATVATLAQIQHEEVNALDNDVRQLLRYGSGIALPHTRHVGPSSLYYMPATVKAGLTDAQWEALETNTSADIASFESCKWLHYTWEPSSSQHCFLSALFQQFCLASEYSIEDSPSHKVLGVSHPTIHGLELRFLQFLSSREEPAASQANDPSAMQVDGGEKSTSGADINDEFWIPYALVAKLDPPLPACALTVRKAMEATSPGAPIATTPSQPTEAAPGSVQDSPRLLEDAPTLEAMLYEEYLKQAKQEADGPGFSARAIPQAIHQVESLSVSVELEEPQIRAWTICRIPLSHPWNILSIVQILRRQAIFNELLTSCFAPRSASASATDSKVSELAPGIILGIVPGIVPGIAVSARTFARDPFRIDIVIRHNVQDAVDKDGDKRMRIDGEAPDGADAADNSEPSIQGAVLRVIESTGDIVAWTHQSIGASTDPDLFASMDAVSADALTPRTSDKSLSKVANLSRSIPLVAQWLSSRD